MSLEPPPFQEASRCDVCKCSFNTFRRRHHCRCCGRTLCAEHSSSQMALPQFGLHSLVRVCSDCYNDASRSKKDDSPDSLSTVNDVSDSVSRLDISTVAEAETKPPIKQLDVSECTCGMPLCICEAPAPAPVPVPARDVVTKHSCIIISSEVNSRPLWTLLLFFYLQSWAISSSTSQSNTKPKKPDSKPRSRGSASNSNLGPASNSSSNSLESNKDYEVNGEGLREAIKNGDTVAVRKLLNEGVDANYRDKQGLSLLHLAAVFNQSDIAFVLMDHGASIACKNSQGETPLDCAPVTLQYKMKKKIEEGV